MMGAADGSWVRVPAVAAHPADSERAVVLIARAAKDQGCRGARDRRHCGDEGACGGMENGPQAFA